MEKKIEVVSKKGKLEKIRRRVKFYFFPLCFCIGESPLYHRETPTRGALLLLDVFEMCILIIEKKMCAPKCLQDFLSLGQILLRNYASSTYTPPTL